MRRTLGPDGACQKSTTTFAKTGTPLTGFGPLIRNATAVGVAVGGCFYKQRIERRREKNDVIYWTEDTLGFFKPIDLPGPLCLGLPHGPEHFTHDCGRVDFFHSIERLLPVDYLFAVQKRGDCPRS